MKSAARSGDFLSVEASVVSYQCLSAFDGFRPASTTPDADEEPDKVAEDAAEVFTTVGRSLDTFLGMKEGSVAHFDALP